MVIDTPVLTHEHQLPSRLTSAACQAEARVTSAWSAEVSADAGYPHCTPLMVCVLICYRPVWEPELKSSQLFQKSLDVTILIVIVIDWIYVI